MCYDVAKEVTRIMDMQSNHPLPQEGDTEQEGYVERPARQVWAARIGLVFFLLFVVYQLICIAGGPL